MDNPTHDTVEPIRFDKAWQRAQYHAAEQEAKMKTYLDAEQIWRHRGSRKKRRKVYEQMVDEVNARIWITYEEAAGILGIQTNAIGYLIRLNKISADTPKKLVRRSSVEVYRDTRRSA